MPSVLTSFGFKIGPGRVGTVSGRPPEAAIDDDVQFVVLSYDVGYEKPDRRIFDAATKMLDEITKVSHSSASLGSLNDYDKLYVGDSVEKDYIGAKEANWHAMLIDRSESGGRSGEEKVNDKERKLGFVRGLDELANWDPKHG